MDVEVSLRYGDHPAGGLRRQSIYYTLPKRACSTALCVDSHPPYTLSSSNLAISGQPRDLPRQALLGFLRLLAFLPAFSGRARENVFVAGLPGQCVHNLDNVRLWMLGVVRVAQRVLRVVARVLFIQLVERVLRVIERPWYWP